MLHQRSVEQEEWISTFASTFEQIAYNDELTIPERVRKLNDLMKSTLRERLN